MISIAQNLNAILLGSEWLHLTNFKIITLEYPMASGKTVQGFEALSSTGWTYGRLADLAGFRTGTKVLTAEEVAAEKATQDAQAASLYVTQHRLSPQEGEPLLASQGGKCSRCHPDLTGPEASRLGEVGRRRHPDLLDLRGFERQRIDI